MSKTTKIRWVIAHEPLNLFLRAAEDFERRVNEQQSEHKIEVEIMTLSEYETPNMDLSDVNEVEDEVEDEEENNEMNDEHPAQMAALKLCMDRMLPVSLFEKEGKQRSAVNITISGIGGVTIGENPVIDAEDVEVKDD